MLKIAAVVPTFGFATKEPAAGDRPVRIKGLPGYAPDFFQPGDKEDSVGVTQMPHTHDTFQDGVITQDLIDELAFDHWVEEHLLDYWA